MALITPSLALAQAAEPASKDTQTITVTATKRVERLQDTPTAITAFSGEKLEQLGVEKFVDYVSLIPNLSQAGGGGAGVGTVVMRADDLGFERLSHSSPHRFRDLWRRLLTTCARLR